VDNKGYIDVTNQVTCSSILNRNSSNLFPVENDSSFLMLWEWTRIGLHTWIILIWLNILLKLKLKPIMSLKSLRMLYCAYIHSIMTYGIIFWSNSSYTIELFRIQKNVIRIMLDLKKRDSCRDSFKKMKILPLCSQWTYSLMLHTVNNIHLFTRNTEVHNTDTRQNISLFFPSIPFTKVQKGAHYSGIKI
jgi:hypothetical protein